LFWYFGIHVQLKFGARAGTDVGLQLINVGKRPEAQTLTACGLYFADGSQSDFMIQ